MIYIFKKVIKLSFGVGVQGDNFTLLNERQELVDIHSSDYNKLHFFPVGLFGFDIAARIASSNTCFKPS